MKKVKRDTSHILMENVLSLVKESGNYKKAEQIIEYYNSSPAKAVALSNYEFDFISEIRFGSNEGIYLDCWLEGTLSDTQISKSERILCGVFKSLNTDLESVQTLAELGGSLTYYAKKYVNKELKRFYPASEILFDEYKELIKQDKESDGVMEVNTYKTNLRCPRCGTYFYTSDISGYPFVCFNCDENFYGMEADFPEEGYVSMKVNLKNKEQGKKLFYMIEPICKVNGCCERFLNRTYTSLTIRWKQMPSAEEIRNMALGIALYQQEVETENPIGE